MLKLRTVLSYGLNNQLRDDFVKEDIHVSVGFKFPALPRISTTISQRHVHKLNSSVCPDVFLNNFNFHLQNEFSNFAIKNNEREKK